jgi:hypothetical protein
MGKPIEKKLKQKFLKQIEDYNDFIVQNDLDAEKINPDHDYDFSAFTSPEDWAVESERLSDRLSDRKIEIAQNEDNGEFQGMELENGVPSYEAAKEMSPEEFKAYEQKYLTPSADIAEPQQVGSDDIADTNATVTAPIVVPVIDTNRTDDLNVSDNNLSEQVDFSDDIAELADANVPKSEPEHGFSLPLGWELFKGTHPGIKNAVDAVDSVTKVIDQGEPVNALQDAGRGIMSGLAGTAGSIADLGGLVPNGVANFAHDSSDWWKDQYEIVNSEAGSIGDRIGSEAVAGVAGGAVGRVAGKAYQGMKRGGEKLRKRATAVAKDREDMAKSHGLSALEAAISKQKVYENVTAIPPRHSYAKALFGDAQPIAGSVRIDQIPYGHPMNEKDLLTKAIRERSHMNGKDLDGGYSAYDVLNPVAGKMEYPTPARLADAMIHNTKRKIDSRAMMKRNDAEIETMFNQGTLLDDALKIRQDRWNRLPMQGAQTGTVLGLAIGQ